MADIQFICFIPASEKIISNVILQQILPGGFHQEITLVITEFNLHLFRENSFSSGYTEFACHPYSNLFLIDYIDDLTFRLVLSTNNSNRNRYCGQNIVTYTLFSENATSIIETIYQSAKKTLPFNNYLRINPKNKDILYQNKECYFSTPCQSFIHRYRALLAWKKIFPSQNSLQKLRNFISTNTTNINLGTIMDLNFDVESFIHASDVIPEMNTVVISGDAKHSLLYEILTNVIISCPHIQKLTVIKQINQSFYNFLSFLNRHDIFSIQFLQFQDCQISPSLVRSIHSLLSRHKINLTFDNCDFSQNLNKLLSIIDSTQNFTYLTISSNTTSIQSLPQMKNLKHLELRGCVNDISSLLSSLKEKVPNIEYLDLSKNECASELPQTVSLPDTLKELFLSRIRWTPNNFTTVFKSCCLSSHPISLSLADAVFDARNESFIQFFESVKDIQNIQNPNLSALYWNHNHIRSIFMKFLLKCNNLKFISFSGCKIKKHVIPSLQKFFENSTSIQIIDLHGSIRTTFSDILPKLFGWLKKSKSVKQIDVSKNNLNEKSIASLSDLISANTRINQILIDDLNISEYSSLQPLVAVIKERKDQINIQFPNNTFAQLKENGQVDDQNWIGIQSLFVQPVASKDQECASHWQSLIDQRYPEWPAINSVNSKSIEKIEKQKNAGKCKLKFKGFTKSYA